jgi:hypothetical protein
MKRLLTLLLLLSLMLCGCKKTPEPTQPSEAEPPTESQPVTEPPQPGQRLLSIRTGIVSRTGGTETRTEYRLDDKSQISEVLIYTDAQLTQRYRVQSDEHGNPVRWESDTAQISYTYSDGALARYEVYQADTLVSATEYTRRDGLLVCVSQKMPLQALELRQDMAYDANGHLLRQDDYRNGILECYTVYTLNNQGNAASATTYLADGTVSGTVSYTYEGSTVTATAADGSFTRQVSDTEGHLILSGQYSADGTEITCQEYQWTQIRVDQNSQRISI